jgi:hypothetical protein
MERVICRSRYLSRYDCRSDTIIRTLLFGCHNESNKNPYKNYSLIYSIVIFRSMECASFAKKKKSRTRSLIDDSEDD